MTVMKYIGYPSKWPWLECKTVCIFVSVKNAQAVKRKVSSEGEKGEWDWRETRRAREARSLRAFKKLPYIVVKQNRVLGNHAYRLAQRLLGNLVQRKIFIKNMQLNGANN